MYNRKNRVIFEYVFIIFCSVDCVLFVMVFVLFKINILYGGDGYFGVGVLMVCEVKVLILLRITLMFFSFDAFNFFIFCLYSFGLYNFFVIVSVVVVFLVFGGL